MSLQADELGKNKQRECSSSMQSKSMPTCSCVSYSSEPWRRPASSCRAGATYSKKGASWNSQSSISARKLDTWLRATALTLQQPMQMLCCQVPLLGRPVIAALA